MPFFEIGRPNRYSTGEVVNILRNSGNNRKCSQVPQRVRENAAFLVDVRSLDDWEDVKADMNGVYSGFIKSCIWTIDVAEGVHIVQRSQANLKSDTQVHFVQHIRKNKVQPLLSRGIYVLKDRLGKVINNICLLQYTVNNSEGKVEFDVSKHGNALVNKPYYPPKKSMIAKMKNSLEKGDTSSVLRGIREDAGGICEAEAPSDIPRGKQQVYDAKRQVKCSTDDVADMLKYGRDKEDVILHHSDYPEDLWVLGTSLMCAEASRSSTSEIISFPISIDPTFNLGRFEVTPVVFQHALLKSKRTGESPIFLSPTMIHHSKSYEMYKSLAQVCSSKAKGLSKLRSFVTDGEQALHKAFSDQFPDSQGLRCFKHFQNNCKDKLRAIGIRNQKQQDFFIHATFGVRGKEGGILDAVDGDDLRRRLDSVKFNLESKERECVKNPSHIPKYWKYLDDNYNMIESHMVQLVRRKGGLREENGKPVRSYTNSSESMNKIMKSKRDTFLKEHPHVSSMTKLQFTKHIFEEIHKEQNEGFMAAVAGMGDAYELADCAAHLSIPPDVWFEWSKEMRKSYIDELLKASMEDIFSGKEVPWPTCETGEQLAEFKGVDVDIVCELVDNFNYTKENAESLQEAVVTLINHPYAVQPKACLSSDGSSKYEVASSHAKNGTVEVSVYKDHVTCVCGRFKHDKICKHSLAVAEKQSLLSRHLSFVKRKGKKGSFVTPLAEHDVKKGTAGKKGGRNQYNYRPARGKNKEDQPSTSGLEGPIYTEIHHNDNNFVLRFLPQDAKFCKACDTSFCHRSKVPPHDLVFEHKERWFYPMKGDWANRGATRQEAVRYYHIRKTCLMTRFPYFNSTYVEIPPKVNENLSTCHKDFLTEEVGVLFSE